MRPVDRPSSAGEVVAVVVTYNGADWIQDCLQSLANSHHPVTTIVVDNGSTDDSLTLVATFPDVICLPQKSNLGFGQANNIGIREALGRKARWVFLLNQDARVEPETVAKLVQASVTHPGFGILSPFHLDGEGAHLDARFATFLSQAELGLLSDLYLGRKKEVYSTAFVNAAAWLVTSDCLDTVGGFDPLFFMYGEDNDYCHRATWHGFEIGLVPGAAVFHDRPADRFSEGVLGIPFESIVAWRFSVMLPRLTRPDGLFFWRIGSWGLQALRTGFVLIGHGQLRDFLAWKLALLRVIARLPTIWKHRSVNRAQGRHWL